jgi:hypothetical protein
LGRRVQRREGLSSRWKTCLGMGMRGCKWLHLAVPQPPGLEICAVVLRPDEKYWQLLCHLSL